MHLGQGFALEDLDQLGEQQRTGTAIDADFSDMAGEVLGLLIQLVQRQGAVERHVPDVGGEMLQQIFGWDVSLFEAVKITVIGLTPIRKLNTLELAIAMLLLLTHNRNPPSNSNTRPLK